MFGPPGFRAEDSPFSSNFETCLCTSQKNLSSIPCQKVRFGAAKLWILPPLRFTAGTFIFALIFIPFDPFVGGRKVRFLCFYSALYEECRNLHLAPISGVLAARQFGKHDKHVR